MIAAFLFMAVEGAMLGALSYMIRPMFDDVFIDGDKQVVFWVALSVFGVFGVRAVAGFMQSVLVVRIGQRMQAAIQSDLLAHLMTLDSVFFQHNAPGALIARVSGDTAAIQGAWSSVFAALGRDIIALVSLFAVALSVDWRWTLIAVAAAPLMVIPVYFLQRWIRLFTQNARNALGRITTRLDEIFHSVNSIKLNNLEGYERKHFDASLGELVRAEIRSRAASAAIPALMDILAGVGLLAVLTYGGYQIIDGEKTVGEFMSFFTAMALIFEPLRRLGNVSGAWQVALVSIERINRIFEERPGIVSPKEPVQTPAMAKNDAIVLKDVCFRYEDMPVLDGVSFTAEVGKTTALVGASGAGKSTVFNVLTRLVEPQSGSVTIGGTEIRDFALTDLRQLYSVVTQDASLFDETLRENIVLGRPDVTTSALKTATDAAFVTDFANTLPLGLDSEAGPRGSNLSGGQKQRIAIARAVLRDAPILLLDEPTSALDAQSEAAVQKALDGLSKNRTTLVIAHRLATILDADKIVVMDKGRVVDEGTHEELLARDGIYAGLYRLQFRK